MVCFGSMQSTSIQLGPFSSLRSNSIKFGPFDLLQLVQPTSVYFGPLVSLWSIQSNLFHLVIFCLFSPFGPHRSNLVCLVHFVHLSLLRSNLVYLLKNEKIQVWVDSTVNYFSNINCNYKKSFCYHNNLLKRMRIWIITLKLKNFSCTNRN